MLGGGCFTIQALGSHGPWRETKSLHKGEVLSAQYFQLLSGEYFLLKPLKILKQPLPVSPSGLTVSLGSQLLALWLVCEKKEDVTRGTPACPGTLRGRRKAVRDRLALQGGTGDFP